MSRRRAPVLLWFVALCCFCCVDASFHISPAPSGAGRCRHHEQQEHPPLVPFRNRGGDPRTVAVGGGAFREPTIAKRFRAPSTSFLRSNAGGNGGGEALVGSDAVAAAATATATAAEAAADATKGAAATSSSLARRPQIGDVVSIRCRLVPEGSFVPEPLIDGVVLHHECHKGKNDGSPADLVPITMVLGKGNYLPGLHELILTRLSREGDRVTNIALDAGYGARNPNLVAEIAFDSLAEGGGGGIDPSQIELGTQLQLSNGLVCTVTQVTPGHSFVIDGNHPLAGASYRADVELVRVENGPNVTPYVDGPADTSISSYQVATFALGCFWGGELEYMRERGVVGTRVGYTQGTVENPTYEQVCGGTTGHTEAMVVTYDPQMVSYERLVHLAMNRLGDSKYLPNQVGNDRGTQYRHGIYYHNRDQKAVAERIVASYGEDCRTECLPAQVFYDAEEYHQQYLLKGGQSARKGDSSVIRCYG